MTAISITLFVLTLIAWAAVVANSVTLNSSDPAGNALSSAYGVLLVLALWILLAILINLIVIWLVLRSLNWIERILGKAGLLAVRKFFGVILLAIGVKIFATNASGLIK